MEVPPVRPSAVPRSLLARVPDRILVRVAAATAVLAVACFAVAALLQTLVVDRTGLEPAWSDPVLGVVWPAVGALVVRAQPRNVVGWLMLVPAFLGPYTLLSSYAVVSTLVAPAPLPGAGFAAWVGSWGFLTYFLSIPLLPFFFPDGRLASSRWRPVVGAVAVLGTATTLFAMLFAPHVDGASQVDNPLALPSDGWYWPVLLTGLGLTAVPGIVLGAVSVVLRLRRATGPERAQLQWLLLGSLVPVVGLVLSPALDQNEFLLVIMVLGPPLGIAVAVFRHGLFDVEVVLNRALVFTVLSVLVIAVYAGVVFGARLVAPDSTGGILLVATVALVAATARSRLQRWVAQLLFGHRHDPYAVVARIGRHVDAASEPGEALQRLADALRTTLRLPRVVYVHENGRVLVRSGRGGGGEHEHRVPARTLGRTVGELRIGARPGVPSWSDQELQVLAEVASRAATLAYAAELVADVARSREAVVRAREEQRARLTATLRERVEPALDRTAREVGDLVGALAPVDPLLAELARTLQDRLLATDADLEALVRGLRPSVLDRLGLEGALRAVVADHDPGRCEAVVGALGPLPAGVEVAAYAIAGEAVGNAARHSAASRIVLSARVVDDVLVVEVRDNGRGIPDRPAPGVGLMSMGERAVEIGGRLDVDPARGGGTVIRASLPLTTATGGAVTPRTDRPETAGSVAPPVRPGR